MTTCKPIVDVRDLRIQIQLDEGTLTPVRGVDFRIYPGRTLGLVGESGCGKSLTCKELLRINDPKCHSTGRILFDDGEREQDILALPDNGPEIRSIRGRKISMIFQEPMSAFSPLFTIGDQVAEAVLLHITKSKKAARQIAIETMRKVGIANPEKRFDQYPHEFSGGMLQRALIAMALVCKPRLLIADEPTTALDVTIHAQILDLMKEMQGDLGMAILYITHDLGTVARMCDDVAVMYLGRIVEYASAEEIFARPLHPYTRGLMNAVHKIGGEKGALASIDGVVPLAMNLPDRCGFFERCQEALPCCASGEPPMVEASPGHFVACCHFGKEAQP